MNETVELKKRVDKAVRLGRAYYISGDTTLLPDFHQSQEKVRELNNKVFHVLDDCSMFYMVRYYKNFNMKVLTYKQIYHIIDLVCGTNLEGCEDEQ